MRMSKVCFLLLFPFIPTFIYAQIIEENFDYETGAFSTVQSDWTKSAASVEANIIEGNLNYSDYPSSGIGKQLELYSTSSTDYQQGFTSVSSGTLYTSFLLNVLNSTGLNSDGDHFIHYKSGASHCALLKIKEGSSASVCQLGIGKVSSSSPSYATSKELGYNTTYLIVIAYKFNSGSSTDDEVKLWINPSLSGSEPSADVVFTDSETDVDDLDNINIRQALNTPNAYVDGIRVADSWASAPLPVELINFEGKVLDNKVKLEWLTATEVNNYGFEIERANPPLHPLPGVELKGWVKIGFVSGYGNSNSPKYYSYIDSNPLSGINSYRLKQIDFNGAYEYSPIIDITFGKEANYILEQNYPNPFNPTTTIKFNLPSPLKGEGAGERSVTLAVYDVLGREVAVLINQQILQGRYEIEFDGSNLPSGIYYYTLSAGSYRKTKKMLLIK